MIRSDAQTSKAPLILSQKEPPGAPGVRAACDSGPRG